MSPGNSPLPEVRLLYKIIEMKSIYSIAATSTGGRNGHVTTDHQLIDADLGLPRALGGIDDLHLTPEAFFAAGYASCFDNALMHVIRLERIKTGPAVVSAKVDLLLSDINRLQIAVELKVELPGIDYTGAKDLVAKAHEICPYSNAVRGNIEVKIIVINS